MKLRLLALLLVLIVVFSACQIVPIDPAEPSIAPTVETTEPTGGATEETTEGATEETTEGATEAPTEGSTEPPVKEHQCPDVDPYTNVSKSAFYDDYSPACCLTNALYRSKHYLMSGSLDVPGQYAEEADYQPMEGNLYVRNTASCYADDGNTYIVLDGYGKEVMRIYRGGAYITLEEVAAYMYAFGSSSEDIPANYIVSDSGKPSSSQWGEYLRLNHKSFSGSTSKYPYEPELPDIMGSYSERLVYYEMDIGTTGTKTTSQYPVKIYNNGSTITRGAARIVHTRYDRDGNGKITIDEVYVFYTHNHYNDFREYLNYYGGWGEMFGNITGGGTLSSKTDCNPTPYVITKYADFTKAA